MNNLSQECIEQIKQATVEFYGDNQFSFGGQRDGSIWGMSTALTNPTIYQSAGLITVEEVDSYVRWRAINYFYSFQSKGWISYKSPHFGIVQPTELLTIFRNQNKEK